MVRRLGLIQIDSVNVLVRSHYLPALLAARVLRVARCSTGSAYANQRRALFEYWGHEASLLPVELQPLLRWRMERARAGVGIWAGVARLGRERAELCESVLAEIRARGPIGVSDLEGAGRRRAGWWGWSEGKVALEWLFWTGQITTHSRRRFERVYDLTERALPSEVISAAHARARGRAARPAAHRDPGARSRDGARPARLFPSHDHGRERPHRGARRGRRAAAGRGRGLARAGLPGSRRNDAAPRDGAGVAVAVRFAGVGATAHGASVRVPIPARDLHTREATRARLLRAALSARRPPRRARRPQGGPAEDGRCASCARTARRTRIPSEVARHCARSSTVLAAWLGLDRITVSRRRGFIESLRPAVSSRAGHTRS